jgi:hypothetical protein
VSGSRIDPPQEPYQHPRFPDEAESQRENGGQMAAFGRGLTPT